jgi:hypothetical protein
VPSNTALARHVPRSRPTRRQRNWQLILGLGINAGHDLNLENLTIFRDLPHLDEVSIGHAIMSRALFVGLDRSSGYRPLSGGHLLSADPL